MPHNDTNLHYPLTATQNQSSCPNGDEGQGLCRFLIQERGIVRASEHDLRSENRSEMATGHLLTPRGPDIGMMISVNATISEDEYIFQPYADISSVWYT
jgi:hypothetical protein